MILSETGGAPVATPSMGVFKARLRLSQGFEDDMAEDEALAGYLASAVVAIERRLAVVLVARRFVLSLSRLDRDGRLRLPVGPVHAIDAAALEGPSGMRPLSTGDWTVEATVARPAVGRAGGPLPPIPAGHRLRLDFEAGLAPDWVEVPADLAEAVLLLAAYWHDGGEKAVWPAAVRDLCAPWAPVRL